MSAVASFPWSHDPSGNPGTGFHSILEHAPFPVVLCNAEGMISEVNSAFERVLEWKNAPARRLLWRDLLNPEAPETADSLLRDLLNGTHANLRIKAKCLNGKYEITDWIVWRTAEGNGKSSQVILAGELNPELASAARHSAQGQRWESIGRLTGGVVHDFNNLMTGVTLYCDLLLSNLDQDETRLRRYAEGIRAAVAQTSGLVQQLLLFARPKPAELYSVSLNHVAETMRNLLVRLIGENVVLEFRLDPALAQVEIEQTQLEQVLLNLILNARDAMPQGGHILIETSNCNFQPLSGSASLPSGFPCVLLAVTDNGRGMDAQTRQRLFEPFFTTKDSGTGSGLGLTTVRTIVTNNRGLIHIDSEAGRGTRVMILLPHCSKTTNFPHLAHSASNSQETTLREDKRNQTYDLNRS
jgi:signal transduction histidine kinase